MGTLVECLQSQMTGTTTRACTAVSAAMQRDVGDFEGVTPKTLPVSFHHRPYFKTPCLLAFSEAPASFSSSFGIFGPLGM